MQNSQRVLLAKPRNGNWAHDVKPHEGFARHWGTSGAHDAKPRTAPMARRRDGDIAPYRKGARVEHGDGTRVVRTRRETNGRGMPSRAPRRWHGGAMGTSRPTAKPHEEDA